MRLTKKELMELLENSGDDVVWYAFGMTLEDIESALPRGATKNDEELLLDGLRQDVEDIAACYADTVNGYLGRYASRFEPDGKCEVFADLGLMLE